MARAKSRQVQRAQARATRRVDPEQRNRVFIIGAVVGAIVIAIGFIAFGWYWTELRPRGKVVLEVGEQDFTLGHLERRMEIFFEENLAIYQQSPQLLSSLPDQVLADLEREAKLVASAGELKIEITEADVDNEIASKGNVTAEAGGEAFANAYRDLVRESGLHTGEYRQMVKAELLQRRVSEYFTYVAPAREPQVWSRWIQLEDEDDATGVIGRLEAGEDFAAVAREVSQDASNKEQGGVFDWTPRGGGFPDQKVEDFLFEAEPGQRSEPIQALGGFYVVELLGKDDNRELTEQQKQQVVARLVRDWLEGLDSNLTIELHFSDSDRTHALDSLAG